MGKALVITGCGLLIETFTLYGAYPPLSFQFIQTFALGEPIEDFTREALTTIEDEPWTLEACTLDGGIDTRTIEALTLHHVCSQFLPTNTRPSVHNTH